MRIIACIEDPVVIEKILAHLDAKRLRCRLPARRRPELRPRGARAVSPPALRRSLSGPPEEDGRRAAALRPPSPREKEPTVGCNPLADGHPTAAAPLFAITRRRESRGRPAHERRALGTERLSSLYSTE